MFAVCMCLLGVIVMRPWWACVGPAGLSSDSGLGGSTDVLVFESVVDSVTEEGESTTV